MNSEMYDKYYDYKIKTVCQYSKLLSKILGISKNKLWHNNRDLDKSLDKIINSYFKQMLLNNRQDKTIVRCFLNDKDIYKYNIEKELLCVINYFVDNGMAFEIKAYEKEIVLAAIIIKIANELDVITSPYMINKNNYKTILMGYIEKYNKIEYINIIDEGKKQINILLELIKTNVKKERRIFELLNSNVSFNRYVDISLENRYYLTQYNYSVPNIKDVDLKAAEYIFKKDHIDSKCSLISADLIIVTLMKLLSVRKFNKMFFLPLKADFFLNEDNLKGMSFISKDSYLSKNFKLLLNYDEVNDNILNLVNKYKLSYYIYASKSSNVKETHEEFRNHNYLISKDFYLLHKDFIDERITENINIVIEAFDGMVTDRMLVENS